MYKTKYINVYLGIFKLIISEITKLIYMFANKSK